MDKKYVETLPNLVRELPAAALSDDENGAMNDALRKKSRKSKKCTIRKNGLYPGEELSISKWWISRNTTTEERDTGLHGEEFIKTQVMMQRAREIQLQIILILETLALERLVCEIKLEPLSSQAAGDDRHDACQKPKSKKPKDLHVLLDVLVDRLCIWQSMDADEVHCTPNGKIEIPQKKASGAAQSSRLDHLRAFCVEVLLPL